MKPLAGSRSRLVQVAKAAVLKNPRKYKNVGGVGSSPRSPKSGSSPRSPRSPKSGNSPRSGSSPRSPIISISIKDKNKLIDISHHIVALINNYKALSEVSAKEYSFNVLDPSKKDFLVFTRNTTKLIKNVIDKIFVEVNESQFISIDTSSYTEQINNILIRITPMTTDNFIVETTYTRFFDDLRDALLTFFDYIQKNIKINEGISNKEIIYIFENEILRCAIGGYAWFSDIENKRIGAKNIKLFMNIQINNIKKQQDRENAEFLELIKLRERERERVRINEDIRAFHACRPNRDKSCRYK
jgi:hypothetical protein